LRLLLFSLLSTTVLAAEPWSVPAEELKAVKNPVAKGARKGSATRGAVLYKAECGSCHGDTGGGDGPDGAYFDPPPTKLAGSTQSDAERFVKVTKGRANMPAYETKLDEKQRWDVVNFLLSLK